MTKQTGLAVRKLRLSKGMTLAQLSDKSGVPLSTLSKLELGQSTLSYDKLMQLCRAMEIDPGMALLADTAQAAPSGRRAIYRGDGETARLGPHNVKIVASDLLSKPFTPLIVEVNARTLQDHGPLVELPGEAYIHVLEGDLFLHTEIYAPTRLRKGEGCYFDARLPHALICDSAAGKALFVFSGEEETLTAHERLRVVGSR
jgi:transcriptional regulator with XRE-family HTH domain